MLSNRVVIIGSGPAGVSAAFPLLEAGLPVLMVDASTGQALPPTPTGNIHEFRASPASVRLKFGDDLSGIDVSGNHSPKLKTPTARAVLRDYSKDVGITSSNFAVHGSMFAGGLSNIWGAMTATYDQYDLRDFPVPFEDMQSAYEVIKRRIGTSTRNLTPANSHVFNRFNEKNTRSSFRISKAVNAVIDEPLDDRGACNSCGLCLYGCGRRSIYNSRFDLEKLSNYPNFTYESNTHVRQIVREETGYLLLTDRGPIKTEVLFLAAGTLGTSALLLRMLGTRDSVRLLDNPVAASAFLIPSLLFHDLPEKTFSLAQLAYRGTLSDKETFAGALYGADALPLSEISNRLPFPRRTSFAIAKFLLPGLLLSTCYLPGVYSSNTIRLVGDKIHIEALPNEAITLRSKESHAILVREMRMLGAYYLPSSFTISGPGNDIHYAGTFPMGQPGQFGTSSNGELTDYRNLFVIDGACLSSLPAGHCTLTIMANAERIGKNLGKILRQG